MITLTDVLIALGIGAIGWFSWEYVKSDEGFYTESPQAPALTVLPVMQQNIGTTMPDMNLASNMPAITIPGINKTG
jgi:hypothetical protein